MSDLEPPVFTLRRRVEFADTDVGGIVHFSRYFVFMETAEHEMLRHLGASVFSRHEGHTIGWPRVEAHCRYLAPACFGDEISIEVRIERRGRRAMTYGFRILRDEELLATGQTSSVCCVLEPDRPPRPIEIPAQLAACLPGSAR